VEYADYLTVASASFTAALTITETNVPAGVESTEVFVDDGTLTGGPVGTHDRFYRVKLMTP
jgi:hypothetical protein